MKTKVWIIALGLVSCFATELRAASKDLEESLSKEIGNESDFNERTERLLSMFQIVSFPNDACNGGTKNGTCYTAAECESKSGTASGTCAQGYGVCCIFTLSPGQVMTENNTYIESSGITSGTYVYTVCPVSSNICQLRLNFDSFVLAGPSTASLSDTLFLNGAPNTGGQPATLMSRCLTDAFSVTNSGGTNPAPICGVNGGEHMYVDVDKEGSSGCNDLVFELGSTGIDTTIPTRLWSIKVSQIECDSPVRAPDGCTQYFYGESANVVQTYNFNGGQHLAFQKQTICVRRERGFCRICWTAVEATDFAVSGTAATNPTTGHGIISSKLCCAYMDDGMNTKGFDCLQIPGALKNTMSSKMLSIDRICGRSVGLITSGTDQTKTSTSHLTVCSKKTPFYVRFLSDGYEESDIEALTQNAGFRLSFKMDSTNC